MAIEHRWSEETIIVDFGHPVSRVSRKQRLFERAWGCEYPDCDEIRYKELTIDHFTPKCIAAALGWTKRRINAEENCQLLCLAHHREKDAQTPAMYSAVLTDQGAIAMRQFLALAGLG